MAWVARERLESRVRAEVVRNSEDHLASPYFPKGCDRGDHQATRDSWSTYFTLICPINSLDPSSLTEDSRNQELTCRSESWGSFENFNTVSAMLGHCLLPWVQAGFHFHYCAIYKILSKETTRFSELWRRRSTNRTHYQSYPFRRLALVRFFLLCFSCPLHSVAVINIDFLLNNLFLITLIDMSLVSARWTFPLPLQFSACFLLSNTLHCPFSFREYDIILSYDNIEKAIFEKTWSGRRRERKERAPSIPSTFTSFFPFPIYSFLSIIVKVHFCQIYF